MSRNKFQSILWNLHISDDTANSPCNQPGHDPLAKLRDFVDMIDRNFLFAYKPAQALSFDEACCPFKGHLWFHIYNPMKPNRFHIKLFQIFESNSGYVLGYNIYVMFLRFEEEPNGNTEHSMPLAKRRGGFNSD